MVVGGVAILQDQTVGQFLDVFLYCGDEVFEHLSVLVEVLLYELLVQQVREEGHCDVLLGQFDEPFGLLLAGDFQQVFEELVENGESLLGGGFFEFVQEKQGDLVEGGDGFHPEGL